MGMERGAGTMQELIHNNAGFFGFVAGALIMAVLCAASHKHN